MRLTELAPGASSDPDVAGITADSRQVLPGFLFAALPGAAKDGREFISDAVAKGAVAILAPKGTRTPANIALIADDDPRHALAVMAARFYGRQPKTICAVTGTNGKTSVADFARQLWTALGHKAASLGTLGIRAPGFTMKGALTTPDPVALHASLARLAAEGVERLAIEASSHGIEQSRLDGLTLAAAAFTNLTRDHLDYHGDMESYRAAKLRLFDALLPRGATAVLNADSAEYEVFATLCRLRGHKVISYGAQGADFRLDEVTPRAHGQRIRFTANGRSYEPELALVGSFQAHNALAALGLIIAAGENLAAAAAALPRLVGAPGRLQLVATHASGAPVYVDYAHTPDALETVLRALRPHAEKRLIVVFGCGGDRDRGKRPEMGRIACELADKVFVTDDNPRSEDPASIRAAIMTASAGATEIGDRAEAIYAAASQLAPGDVLVLAGKGHETGQIMGSTVRPFDDAEVARAAIAALGGRAS